VAWRSLGKAERKSQFAQHGGGDFLQIGRVLLEFDLPADGGAIMVRSSRIKWRNIWSSVSRAPTARTARSSSRNPLDESFDDVAFDANSGNQWRRRE